MDRDNREPATLVEAAALCPHRPHPSALWRWCRRGIKARSGKRIRLNHVRVGGRIFTTQADLARFFAAVAEADAERFEVPRGR